jgi:Ca2+-binding RTX toxin-like protein
VTRISLAVFASLALLAAWPTVGAAAPSCAEGPQIVGSTYYGTPCDDTIRAPRSVTTVYGEGGNDTLYGQRGNDMLFGGPGNDRLYGGVGDDQLRGESGDDRLSGGFGADDLDGQEGDDFVRGDATIDRIENTGGGIDTLSYATGVTPGFFDHAGVSEYSGLPAEREGRGAYINLETGKGDNGLAPAGGGVDEEVDGAEFDVVIGTAFPDYIVGTVGSQTIYGGGGADVILGHGGEDQVFGGDEGDYCETTDATVHECEHSGSDKQVDPRAAGELRAGAMAPQAGGPAALYLTAGNGDDAIVATYSGSAVSFTNHGSPIGSFSVAEPPDSVVVAGLDGNDTIDASGFPASTSLILAGGQGNDHLVGGETEDALIDGPGNDEVQAGAGDDAVPNNEGTDSLHAGAGEDLFVDDAVCEGDLLDGGPDRDNANWANFDSAISIDMQVGTAGLVGSGGQPSCASGSPTTLSALEDVEGTDGDDVLVGDAGDNQLLGRPGHDTYHALAGNDTILANSGDTDLTIDCGEGWDTALIDLPTSGYADPGPVACEDTEERPVNSFRPPGTPPSPEPEPEVKPEPEPEAEPEAEVSSPPPLPPPPAQRGPDRVPPNTRLGRRPGHLVFKTHRLRAIAFAFASNEPGSTYRCRLDRRRWVRCSSPRRFRVASGRHVFRVYAVDRAGNADATPVVYRFRVRQR